MLVLSKDLKSIQKNTEEYFQEVGISTTPGSISKLFSSVINSEISEFYEHLTTYHKLAFVSTSTGEYLDKIGQLLNCKREEKESDDNYRYRITKQILITASANKEAVKSAALSVNGVDDIIAIPYSKGAGSFDLFIVNNEGNISDEVINEVMNRVNEAKGYGINCTVSEPRYKRINIRIKILFKDTVLFLDKDEIIEKVRINIFNYINSLQIGEEFLVNRLTTIILNTDENIVNFICDDFKIDNKKSVFANQYIKSNEKFIINSNYNSIIIS